MDFLTDEWVFLVRLLVAMVLGGVIGLERQSRGRPAGLRTNILVCLGSAAVIVAFQKLFLDVDPGVDSAIRMDPARAAAGVITGIGFMGAGTIVKSKDFVRGLTTAASIWVVSAVGIIVGLGEFVVGTALALLVLLTLYILHRLPIGSDRYARVTLQWQGAMSLLDDVAVSFDTAGVTIKHRGLTREPGTGKCQSVLNICYRDESAAATVFHDLQDDERFDLVSWS